MQRFILVSSFFYRISQWVSHCNIRSLMFLDGEIQIAFAGSRVGKILDSTG